MKNNEKEQVLTPKEIDSSELSCRRSKSISSPPSSPYAFFSNGSPLDLGDRKLNFLFLQGNKLRLELCAT
jgi:hypothetical protein